MLRWPLRRDSRLLRRTTAVRLVAESVAMLLAVRLALSIMGLSRLRTRWLPVGLAPSSHGRAEAGRVIRAVGVAAHLVPFASCLTQAQSAQILLARRGVASTVCLGVRRTIVGSLSAHAWLVVDGRPVLGGSPRDVASFRRLAELAPVL